MYGSVRDLCRSRSVSRVGVSLPSMSEHAVSEKRLTDLLKLRDVADLLGCSQITVRRLIDRGELATVRIGGLVRVKREAVEELIERGS